jgi:hypothetical protein
MHPDNIESWRGETEAGVGIGASCNVDDQSVRRHIQHGLNTRLLRCVLHLVRLDVVLNLVSMIPEIPCYLPELNHQ